MAIELHIYFSDGLHMWTVGSMSRSPKNHNGTLAKYVLLLKKFISAEYVR